MDIRFLTAKEVAAATEHTIEPGLPVVVAAAVEDDPGALSQLLTEEERRAVDTLVSARVIRGKAGETIFLPTPGGERAGVLVVGLGKQAQCGAETWRRAGGAAASCLAQHKVRWLTLDARRPADAEPLAFVEGVAFGQYRFDRYKQQPEGEDPPAAVDLFEIVIEDEGSKEAWERAALQTGVCIEATQWARDLGNRSANDVTPEKLASEAEAMAGEVGAEAAVLTKKQMKELGMGALLAVGKGSERKPRLIILEYSADGAKRTLAMAGKGITFDSGGISIKPGQAMHEMKFDMCGAAAVLGAFKAICTLKPKINVICVVPAAENMPSDEAVTPGDIVKAYNGKTIEVHNTDAEGRMVLADAMSYVAEKYKPDYMVDLATLTGAVIIALGHYGAGLMGTSEDLIEALKVAADQSGERVWELPLWDDFAALMKGDHADLKNIPGQRVAGSITAGCFLKEFTGDIPWAHLDIAGAAWGGTGISYQDPKHATGYGVRLLTQWVLNEADEAAL